MICSKKRLRLCTVLIVLNLCFIWGNSLVPASASQAFSDWVRNVLGQLLGGAPGGEVGRGLIRKLAHFAEFAALGVLFSWLFGMLDKKLPFAFICGVAAACIDETIQCFVPGRGPGLRDVGIDACGVLIGMMLFTIGYYFFKRKQLRRKS